MDIFLYRAKASMSAAADGQLAAKSNNPFAAPGTDIAGTAPDQTAQAAAMDEGDIEAEGIESALVSLERVTALLTINASQGISPGMKVTMLPSAAVLLLATCQSSIIAAAQILHRQAKSSRQFLYCKVTLHPRVLLLVAGCSPCLQNLLCCTA